MFDTPSFTADYDSHLLQISDLEKHISNLNGLSNSLTVETSASMSYLIQRIQVRHFLSTICELNGSISDAIQKSRYSVAEALARISIEMSANLIFVLGGEKHARAKGLIKHHFEHAKSRYRKWSRFSARTGAKSAQMVADQSLKGIESLETAVRGLTGNPFEAWPKSSADKFAAIGQEERYRTLFASSSDSVHLLGEDIVNIILCESAIGKSNPNLPAAVRAEKASFAVYLLISSAIFQTEAIDEVAQRIGVSSIEREQIDLIYADLHQMFAQHESDAKIHRSDETVPTPT